MGICIDIKKYKFINNIHYYHIITSDCGGWDFYVGLSPKSKTIFFYLDSDLKKLIKSIDTSNPESTIGVPPLDSKIVGPVIMRCLRAFRNNDFPESMGWYS